MTSHRRKLTLAKRLLFQFVILLLVYLLLETLSLVYLNSTYRQIIHRRHSIAQQDPVTASAPYNSPMMIHPYLGMVYQPRAEDLDAGNHGLRITEYGFHDDQAPVRKRSADRVIVAILGGSVARQMIVDSSNVLEQRLSQIPKFEGKTIDFVRLAIDGNKQPQQLMILNYLLMLGGEFDLVINLDGVNEISLPSMDNVPFGVAAYFPRKWGFLTSAAASRDLMRSIGYQIYLGSLQKDFAARFDQSIVRYSPTGCLVWRLRNSRWEELQRSEYFRNAQILEKELTICSSGPRQKFASQTELLEHCAEIWARSSELSQQLCQANQIQYFHFLQPNQYLPDSKPMSEHEKETAIYGKSPFAEPVRMGYPILRQMAGRLKASGIEFTDLTQVFADHPEEIYKDDCCHVVPEGDRILAEAIADRIVTFYSRQPAK